MTFDPTLPPPATTTYIRTLLPVAAWPTRTVSRSTEIAVCVGQTVLHASAGVELGARRVEDADDDGADPVSLLEHLADDDVRVVAVGRDDGRVGVAVLRRRREPSCPCRDRRRSRLASRLRAAASASSFSSIDRDVPALRRRAPSQPPSRRGHNRSPLLSRPRQPTPRTLPRGTRPREPRRGRGGGRSRPWARRTATAGASAGTSRGRSGRRPGSRASSTIAWPIDRARTTPGADLDSVILAEHPGFVAATRRPSAATSPGSSPSSSNLRGTRTTVIASISAPPLLRERDRGRDHLLADVAELHRHEDALELRARPGAPRPASTCSSRPRRSRA